MADAATEAALAGLVQGTRPLVRCSNPECGSELGFVYFGSPSGYASWLCKAVLKNGRKCGSGTEAIGTPTGLIFRAIFDKKA